MKYGKGSFIVVPNKEKLKGIGGNAQALFMWLCSYANTNGNCFPSINTLMEDLGCGRNSIFRAMQTLIEIGIVVKTNRKSKKEYLSNEYSVVILDEITNKNMEPPSPNMELPSPYMGLPPVPKRDTNSIHINSIQLTQRIHTSPKGSVCSKDFPLKEEEGEKTEPPFVWDTYLDSMFDNKNTAIQVIAFYFRERGKYFDSKKEVGVAIKRHLRAANQVAVFPEDKVRRAFKTVKEKHNDIDWTLDTILKVLTK